MMWTVEGDEKPTLNKQGVEGETDMFTALTVFFLSIALGARLFFYMPLHHAMSSSYDRVSYFLLDLMYWGFVGLAGIGYIFAVLWLLQIS